MPFTYYITTLETTNRREPTITPALFRKSSVIPLRNRAVGYPTLRRWSHNFFGPAGKAAAVLRRTVAYGYISDFTAVWVSQIWFGTEWRRVYSSLFPRRLIVSKKSGLINVRKVHNLGIPYCCLRVSRWESRRKLNHTYVIWIRVRWSDIHADFPFTVAISDLRSSSSSSSSVWRDL